jgi:hypothetical protein
MDKEEIQVIWAGIIASEVDQYYVGLPMNISEALTHAMKVIRGEVDEKPFTEDESKKHELDEESRKILEDPQILNEFYDILRTCRFRPLVREEANSLSVYLTILSSKATDPVNLSLEGPSQSGKTFLAIRPSDFFSEEMVDVIVSGSKTAYKYSDAVNEEGVRIVKMKGRCLMFLERSESSGLIETLKPLMSHDNERARDRTTQKSDGGEIKSQVTEYVGWPSFIIMGTQPPKNEEIRNRGLILSPEKSREKDEEMNVSDWEAFGKTEEFVKPDLEIWKKAHDWLPTSSVSVHIFSRYFMKLKIKPRERSLLYGLISSITILHSLQRPKHNNILLSSFEDCVISLLLFERAYEHGRLSLSKQQYEVLRHLFDMKKRLGADIFDLDRIYYDIRDTEVEKDTDTLRILVKEDLKKYLEQITEHGYIKLIKQQKKADSWRIISDKTIADFVSISTIFVENVLGDLESIKSSLRDYDEKYDITYPSDEVDENKLYNYIMRKCYFDEKSKSYKGRSACIYRIFDDIRLRDGLFGDKYMSIGREESEKIQEQETERLHAAKTRTNPRNFEEFSETPEYDEWLEKEVGEEEEIHENLVSGIVRPKKTRAARKTEAEKPKPTSIDIKTIRRGRR